MIVWVKMMTEHNEINLDNIDGSLCTGDLGWKNDSQHQTPLDWFGGLFYVRAGSRVYRVLSEQFGMEHYTAQRCSSSSRLTHYRRSQALNFSTRGSLDSSENTFS